MNELKAAILAIGSEITGGRITDTNSSELSRVLTSMGIEVVFHMSCADELQVICQALELSRQQAQLVILTGGLGPTSDDLTRDAVAKMLGVDLFTDEATVDKLRKFFAKLGREMAESNVRQAQFPIGSEIIKNSAGTAPGFWIHDERGAIASMPGVPREMRIMFKDQIMPKIRELQGDQDVFFAESAFRTCGIPESKLGTMLDGLENDSLTVAYAVKEAEGCIAVTLTARANAQTQAQEILDQALSACRERLGDQICATDNMTLVDNICQLLKARNLKLQLFESSAGGRLAALFNSNFEHYNQLASAAVLKQPDLPQESTEARRKHLETWAGAQLTERTEEACVQLAFFGPSTDDDGIVATVVQTPKQRKVFSRASRLPLRSGHSRFLIYGAAMALDKLRLILEQEANS